GEVGAIHFVIQERRQGSALRNSRFLGTEVPRNDNCLLFVLDPQFHHGRPRSALVLRRFGDRSHIPRTWRHRVKSHFPGQGASGSKLRRMAKTTSSSACLRGCASRAFVSRPWPELERSVLSRKRVPVTPSRRAAIE